MLHPLSLIYCQLWGNRLSARQRIGLRSFKSPTSEGTITVTQKGCVCTSRPPRLKPGWPSASSFSSSRISPAARSSIRSSPVSPPASSPTCLLFHKAAASKLANGRVVTLGSSHGVPAVPNVHDSMPNCTHFARASAQFLPGQEFQACSATDGLLLYC